MPCIDFVKIGFFSKWISKNGKALSTRQISRLIASQHFCIQECEIAAIAQVFFYVFLGSKHHMYRIWATLSFNWIVWAREPQIQWQVLTSPLPRLQLQSSHVPSPGPTCCILGSYCDFWGVLFMFGHWSPQKARMISDWPKQATAISFLFSQKPQRRTSKQAKYLLYSLVNLGYTAKYLAESIHIVKHSWSMYFYILLLRIKNGRMGGYQMKLPHWVRQHLGQAHSHVSLHILERRPWGTPALDLSVCGWFKELLGYNWDTLLIGMSYWAIIIAI